MTDTEYKLLGSTLEMIDRLLNMGHTQAVILRDLAMSIKGIQHRLLLLEEKVYGSTG